MKIHIFTTHPHTLKLFRMNMISHFLDRGDTLSITTREAGIDQATTEQLNLLGCKINNAEVTPLGQSIFETIKSGFSLAQINKTQSPDIFLTYFFKGIIIGALGIRSSPMTAKVAIIEGLGSIFTKSQKNEDAMALIKLKLYKLLYKISLANYDGVVFLNSRDMQDFLEWKISSKEKSHLWGPIGINTKEWENDRIAASECTNKKERRIKFVFIGRLIPSKGIESFCRAAAYTKEIHKYVEFQVIGGFQRKQSKFENRIKRMMKEAGIEQLTTNNVRQYLKDATALILPTYYREGYPMVIQEAMAMGVPVITTKYSNCSKEVIEYETGFIVEPTDLKGYISKIEYFINLEKNELNNMANKCRKVAETKFDQARTNEKLYGILNLIRSHKKLQGV